MKSVKKLFLWFLLVVLFSNIQPANFFFSKKQFVYYSTDKTFVDEETLILKVHDYNTVLSRFYNSKHNDGNEVLYRYFEINWFKFWNWREYTYHPRYKLPLHPDLRPEK